MFILETFNPKRILVHLHGFASNLRSSKIQYMRDYLLAEKSFSFFAMDMDYQTTTTTKTLELLDTLVKGFASKGYKVALSGSSHGAYVVLNYLRFYPSENLLGVLLFAPSYSTLSLTVKEEGEEKCKPWLEGKEDLHIYECETGLQLCINKEFAVDIIQKGYEILLDGRVNFPEKPKVPIFIVHGARDEVVPVEHSREFTKRVKVKEYIEVDDDHRLSVSFKDVFKRLLTYL